MSLQYLLDTNVLSIAYRSDAPLSLVELLLLHQHRCAITAPVWHELSYGVARMAPSRRRDFLGRYIQQTVRPNYPILPYDEAAATWHAQERARRHQTGHPTPFVDTMIAAIAVTNDLTLVTNNTKDFEAFEALKLEDWTRSLD